MSKGRLASDTSVTKVSIFRVKKKPRGRSFEPGNGFGAEHRFKPGVSGNLSGRPLCKEVNAASRSFLASGIHKSPRAQTNAEAIVAAQGRKAKKGDLGAAQFLADRAEGRPAISVSMDPSGDNLAVIAAYMTNRSKEIGPPEGLIIPKKQLAGATDDEHN